MLMKTNPVRYSTWLTLFLTCCLLFAEHNVIWLHRVPDVDDKISQLGGSVWRQFAYLSMSAVGLTGAYFEVVAQPRTLKWNWPVATLLSLLLGWCFLSVLWAAAPMIALKRLFVLGLMFSGALGLAMSWTRLEILKFLALSSALQVVVDFGAELANGIVPLSGDYKFSGMLGYNREAYVCIVLTFSALCLVRQKTSDRWTYALIASCGFVFLLLTRSRGGQLAFFTGLMLYLLVSLSLRQRIVASCGIAMLALAIVMSGSAPTLLSVLNRGGEGSENFNGRGPLWEELIAYADRRPLTGYGYENFWTAGMIDDISSDQGWQMSDAHSGYLESLLQLGWPGATLHALTLLTCLGVGIRLFKRTRDYVYFLSAILCLIYLVGGLLEGLMIIKASEISFDFALLLCVTAVQPHRASIDSLTVRTELKQRQAGSGTGESYA